MFDVLFSLGVLWKVFSAARRIRHGLPSPGSRYLTLSVSGVDHPSPVGLRPGVSTESAPELAIRLVKRSAIWDDVTLRRNALDRSREHKAPKQVGTG